MKLITKLLILLLVFLSILTITSKTKRSKLCKSLWLIKNKTINKKYLFIFNWNIYKNFRLGVNLHYRLSIKQFKLIILQSYMQQNIF